MEENILLAAFALLPAAAGFLLYLFIKKNPARLLKLKRPRLVLGNVLFFLVLVSPVLLAGEIYYRFIYDSTDSWGLTKVSLDWYKRHYHFNNYGMRDSVDYQPLMWGKFRVTFLGDSFTAGHGIADVEDRFVNRIRLMRPDLEIHAFAMNGWDTYYQMSILEKLMLNGYQFNQVVLIYNLNDIADIMDKWKTVLERIYSLKPGFLFEHSYFLNILYYRFYAAGDPDISTYYGFLKEAYAGPLWEKQKERLMVLKSSLDARGILFSAVTFPFLNQTGADYEYRRVHEEIGMFWKSIGVPHLDLLTVFEKYTVRDLTVNKHDAHPNKLAHKLAADAIAEFLDGNSRGR